MKKIALSVAALALTAGGALAADLPSRKGPPVLPPPPPPPPMWTGFYAGLNAGYNFGTNDNVQTIGLAQDATMLGGLNILPPGFYNVSLPTGAGLANTHSRTSYQDGFIGGGQIGYNYQWGSSFVIGIEADIQGAGIRGRSQAVGLGGGSVTSPAITLFPGGPNTGGILDVVNSASTIGQTTVTAGVDWLGTVRGRLGYLVTPTMLIYGTGGLTYGGAYANVNQWSTTTLGTQLSIGGGAVLVPPVPFTTNSTAIGGGSRSQTLVGWNAGGGIEWMFMPNWSIKAEAIYWNMGNQTIQTATFAPAPAGFAGAFPAGSALGNLTAFNGLTNIGAVRVNYQGVIARAGVNYHFNWGSSAPVLAKY